MSKIDKMELANWAMEQALKAGADQAAVSIAKTRDVEVEYRDAKIEKLQESTQNGLSIDIYVDSKYSNHSTSDLSKKSLERFISQAVASTKYLSKDEFRSLPDKKLYPTNLSRDLKICDDKYESVEPEDRIKIAAEIEMRWRWWSCRPGSWFRRFVRYKRNRYTKNGCRSGSRRSPGCFFCASQTMDTIQR